MKEKNYDLILDCLDAETKREETEEITSLRQMAVTYMERGYEEGMLDEKQRLLHQLLELEVDPHIISLCMEIEENEVKEMLVSDSELLKTIVADTE